jgi:hypothetical protein
MRFHEPRRIVNALSPDRDGEQAGNYCNRREQRLEPKSWTSQLHTITVLRDADNSIVTRSLTAAQHRPSDASVEAGERRAANGEFMRNSENF